MEIHTIRSQTTRKYFPLLSFLLFLFCLRVGGQLLVALYQVPFLPPMQEWQSGLLPYPVLVVCQFLVIALMTKICVDFYREKGLFFDAKKTLSTPLMKLGWIYVIATAIRFVVWTTVFKHHIWFSGTIPIFFHFILASFVLLVANHHRKALSKLVLDKPVESFSERRKLIA